MALLFAFRKRMNPLRRLRRLRHHRLRHLRRLRRLRHPRQRKSAAKMKLSATVFATARARITQLIPVASTAITRAVGEMLETVEMVRVVAGEHNRNVHLDLTSTSFRTAA